MTATTSWSKQRRSFPRRTARHILTRDPSCQLTLPGCTGTSTQADHIVGDADARALGWTQDQIDDESNGQGVCAPCHKQKTEAEIARGRQRRATRLRRPAERHPGLM